MALYYCRHQRLQLENQVHVCIDCQARFDIIPFGTTLEQPKAESPSIVSKLLPMAAKWGSGGGVLGLVAALGLSLFGPSDDKTKIIEKEIPIEKTVYMDKECPSIDLGKVCPEIPKCEPVYVPSPNKCDCKETVEAACKECRKTLEFFLSRQKSPSEDFRLEDRPTEDEFDEPLH